MRLLLTRYFYDENIVKSRLEIDGEAFCEARETKGMRGSMVSSRLGVGTYRCKCCSSEFAPMTLKVCRGKGESVVMFGWDLLKQHLGMAILLGHASEHVAAEERVLDMQRAVFELFLKMLYRAYGRGEDFELEVVERFEEEEGCA